MLGLAHDLEVKLPGTRDAFWAGIINAEKAEIIAAAAAVLDPAGARTAEALVLGRAGLLTPGGLRSAIARAVMQVAPEKARKRREQAAKAARVERWAEDSGQQGLIVALEPIPTGDCDHRHQARGHDPGVMLRHLTQIRHATCTGPGCRRPATRCDFEHDTPYEAGGRTCLCNENPKCRHDHRIKQDPRWQAEQLPSGDARWTTPSGRQYTTQPTRHPI